MGRVQTNNVTLQVAREEPGQFGVLPTSPDWKVLEPNGITTFGPTISTVARNPISPNRQRRKGTITDLDSSVEFEADLTIDSFTDFMEAFVSATAVNKDLLFNEVDATGTGYTIPAATAAQAAKLQFTSGGPISLMYARGYATAANNGLKELGADVSSSDTEIEVAGLTAETAPAKAILEIAGIRPEEGDLALTVSGATGTLTSNNNSVTNALDFTTLGLTVGQTIHIGGLTTANQFSAGAGYARIASLAAQSISLDKMDATLATDPGAAETVDLLFGLFVRNVSVGDPEFLEISHQFEATYPNLGSAGQTEYEYALGNFCNQLTVNLPLTDKATATFAFLGTDTETPTQTRKTNASSPREPIKTSAVNTTSDVARLRVTEVDETGLMTDFKSLTLTINNNVSAQKCIGNLGALFVNTGIFEIDIEAQVLFTSSGPLSAIRENRTVSMDFRLKNDNGAIAFDIPSMTLGGGGKEFPLNETVLLNSTAQAFADDALDTSISASLFAVTP